MNKTGNYLIIITILVIILLSELARVSTSHTPPSENDIMVRQSFTQLVGGLPDLSFFNSSSSERHRALSTIGSSLGTAQFNRETGFSGSVYSKGRL